MQFSQRHRRKAAINIISLVDVVFLLLIFFMVSATFMDQPALKINLPESGAEPPDSDAPEPMTVYLTSQGELYFGDQMVRVDELPEMFKQSLGEGKPPVLNLKADKEVTHGKVIEVMDLARQSGIEMVTVATERKQQ
ncbi:MAG: biopolymer transporter ExbD [Candidatus Glassbacteria bacterium]|nr:biopolymer transporter ExbD [Candidatus Glassbacteria bacterium]